MANLYEKASLVLPTSPAYKDGAIQAYKPLTSQGTFDFSRGSNLAATRVDVNGLIEKGRENLLLYSNDFSNTIWLDTAGSCTRVGNQIGYDGSSDAWLITQNTSGFDSIINNTTAVSGVHTFSVYAKANTGNTKFTIRMGGTGARVEFNLTGGSVGTIDGAIDTNITSIGSGWYRCSAAFNCSNDQFRITPQWGSATEESVYIQDAQLEQGLVATDYIETGADTAQAGILEDMPRLDYSGGASCPALLLEPQRTNLITQSEASTEWVTTRARNEIGFTSPEGVDNATKVIPNTDNDDHYTRLTDSISQSFTNGTTYTISFYVKAAEHSSFELALVGLGVTTAQVDLSDESHNVGELEDAGNGWYRFYYTFTADNTSAQIRFFPNTNNNFVGNDSDGILIYGAQVEQGSYPTSYIPTYGTSTTRGKDLAIKSSATSVIGQTEGTLFFEIDDVGFNSTGGAQLFSLDNGTNLERIEIYTNTLNYIGIYVQRGSAQVSQVTSIKANGLTKVALAYAENDYKLYINGALAHTDTEALVPTCNNIRLQGRYDNLMSGKHSNKQALLFKTRLSNAELEALTTL